MPSLKPHLKLDCNRYGWYHALDFSAKLYWSLGHLFSFFINIQSDEFNTLSSIAKNDCVVALYQWLNELASISELLKQLAMSTSWITFDEITITSSLTSSTACRTYTFLLIAKWVMKQSILSPIKPLTTAAFYTNVCHFSMVLELFNRMQSARPSHLLLIVSSLFPAIYPFHDTFWPPMIHSDLILASLSAFRTSFSVNHTQHLCYCNSYLPIHWNCHLILPSS